jgi:hypothetical protein
MDWGFFKTELQNYRILQNFTEFTEFTEWGFEENSEILLILKFCSQFVSMMGGGVFSGLR